MAGSKNRCNEEAWMRSLTPGDRRTQEYMCALKSYMDANSKLACTEPYVRWMPIRLGRDGFEFTAFAKPSIGKIQAALQISPRNALEVYDALESDRHTINREFGRELIWRRQPNGKRCLILTGTDADIDDRDDRLRQFAWFRENLEQLDRVFRFRVNSLASLGNVTRNDDW